MVTLLLSFMYYLKLLKPIRSFWLFSLFVMLLFDLVVYLIGFRMFNIWIKLLPINIVFLVYFTSILFYEKTIRLRTLTVKVSQLENEIIVKLAHLDKLDIKIDSQTEQFKLIQYLNEKLQTIKLDAVAHPLPVPNLIEDHEIIKEQLTAKIEELKQEKESIEKEKQKLEGEKTVYEKLLSGKKEQSEQKQIEKPTVDKLQSAKEMLAALKIYQSVKIDDIQFSYGIVSASTIQNESIKQTNPLMEDVIKKIQRISEFESTVLITGEHGTGKELVAKAIHQMSRRANRPLITINCAAIPENLLESELFGHVKGAFTHAMSDRQGAFELANNGTIFLDEIGDLKLDLQAKLLRVIQEKEFQKVGSSKSIHVDTRILAATNKNLPQSIEKNEFRSDLYFRLNVVNIHMPPLNQRKEDIPFLILFFLKAFNQKYNHKKSFDQEAILAAMCYDWPGNVRMLQHCVEQVCVMTPNERIDLLALPENIQTAYRSIFESDDVPWWRHIEEMVRQEQNLLLDACKKSIRDENIDNFKFSDKQNCFDYLNEFLEKIGSIFPAHQKESLIRKTIVEMQDHLFQWCRQEKIAKLSLMYDKIEKLLGRSRRQIDNWSKE